MALIPVSWHKTVAYKTTVLRFSTNINEATAEAVSTLHAYGLTSWFGGSSCTAFVALVEATSKIAATTSGSSEISKRENGVMQWNYIFLSGDRTYAGDIIHENIWYEMYCIWIYIWYIVCNICVWLMTCLWLMTHDMFFVVKWLIKVVVWLWWGGSIAVMTLSKEFWNLFMTGQSG